MVRTASFVLLAFFAALTGCASNDLNADTRPTPAPVNPAPPEDLRSKTEMRLQLERSVDQWYAHFQQQQYKTADGIATALEAFVSENFDDIVEDARSASPRFRKVACAALGFSGQEAAIPVLVGALRDPFEEVVLSSLLALWNLAKAGEQIPVDPVVPYLSHVAPDVRSNAAMVLARAAKPGDGQLFLPLTSSMEDVNDVVRVHAAAALGNLADAGAVPFLLKGLKDQKPLVRIRSAYALGRIKDPHAAPGLVDAIGDPELDVSKAAHKALQTITDRDDIERTQKAWQNYLELRQATKK
jgi:HEAT repeat protein